MRTLLRSGIFLVLALAIAATGCSGDEANELLDPMDQDGVPEDPEVASEPLPDLGGPGEGSDDATDDAGAAPGADAGPAKDAGAPKPPPPATCVIIKAPAAAYLKYGLHPRASDALQYLKVPAGRVVQTIGNLDASAGTHAQDGTAEGKPYTAAVDLSTRDMTDAQVSVFLDKLTSVGFVAYYRKPGFDGWPSSEARHIHAIWVGAKMKLSLRNQVRDWRVGKNGLASHTTYKFKTWSQCWRDAIWKTYLTANPATG